MNDHQIKKKGKPTNQQFNGNKLLEQMKEKMKQLRDLKEQELLHTKNILKEKKARLTKACNENTLLWNEFQILCDKLSAEKARNEELKKLIAQQQSMRKLTK